MKIVLNDLAAVLLSNGDIENAFEYRVTPMEQLSQKQMVAYWLA